MENSCCGAVQIDDLGEQCEENCDVYHLTTFAPPACEKCCSQESCSCTCHPTCNSSCCQRLYQRIKHNTACPPCCPRTSNCEGCSLTPRRRDVIRPVAAVKLQCDPTHYSTIYRKSYDVPTCHLPLY